MEPKNEYPIIISYVATTTWVLLGLSLLIMKASLAFHNPTLAIKIICIGGLIFSIGALTTWFLTKTLYPNGGVPTSEQISYNKGYHAGLFNTQITNETSTAIEYWDLYTKGYADAQARKPRKKRKFSS